MACKVHPAPVPTCRALLSDRSSATLIVLGFLSLPPLLVLASATRARLARRLRPLLPPPTWTPGPRRHPGSSDGGRTERRPDEEEQLCAWLVSGCGYVLHCPLGIRDVSRS
ncbi:transmembrane protein 88B [Glossophaga mutica]